MKILELRKKIVINSVTSLGSLLIFCGCLFYNIHQNTQIREKADRINSEAEQIQNQATELQGKTLDIKKYMAIWRNLDESKKNTSGIKMDDINSLLASMAAKYNISDPVIKVNLPETLTDGVFNSSKINVLFTTVSLTFKSLDDNKALLFMTDFTNSLPGYVVISSLEVKKDKSYTTDDLIAISAGKGSGIVNGSLNFFWYAFKNKATVAPAAAPAKTN